MRKNRLLVALAASAPAALLALPAAPASASGGNPWTPSGSPAVSTLTAGPWTVNQGNATYASPLGTGPAAYCSNSADATLSSTIREHLNPGGTSSPTPTDIMEPFYFPLITSNDGHGNLTGLFDWRPKDNNEAVLEATSTDNGHTWTAVNSATGSTTVLRYRSTCGTPNADDNGQGHANTLTLPGGGSFLYTLDRNSASVDSLGLLIHSVGTYGDVTGLPHDEKLGGTTYGPAPGSDPSGPFSPGATYLGRTTGLTNPDGILGVVPGATAGASLPDGTTLPTGAVEVAYLEKDKSWFSTNDTGNACTNAMVTANTGKSANNDRTTLRIAWTTNGINFTDAGVISFTNEFTNNTTSLTATRFIGISGSLVQYSDGTYGLWFSGGNCSDGDSDAYHYIGYAHSTGTNPNQFTIDNGWPNPIYSVDYTFPTGVLGTPRSYYTGRTYAPQIIPSADGTSAELLFSGYQYPKPTTITNTGAPNPKQSTSGTLEYRAILTVNLTLASGSPTINTAAMANYNANPAVGAPEVPWALALPLVGLALAGGAVFIHRRRQTGRSAA